MGIPVIGSSCGEIPNVIARPDLIFPENNADSLANILERLISDSNFWEEARSYCIKRVQKYYTNESIAHRLINLWQQTLKPQNRQDLNELPQNSTTPVVE